MHRTKSKKKLAFVEASTHEAAYARSDLFERRRRLMDECADYLDRPRAKVVPLRR